MYIQKHIFKKLWWVLMMVMIICMVGCEKREWEEAEGENTLQAYEAFLEQYPEGTSAEKARFQKARLINTIPAYEEFLHKHPQGTLADKAHSKIKHLNFKWAESFNTIPSYVDFLKKYPQGTLADKARSKIEKLYNERHSAYRHTRTIRIIVKQSYDKAKDVSLPFEDVARRICRYAGLKVVNADADDYDVVLKIQAKGSAINAFYFGTIDGYHYSGASLSGIISLKAPIIPAYEKSFEGYISPPESIGIQYPTPSSAPFYNAYELSSFKKKMIEMMEKLYGPNILITIILMDEDLEFREASVDHLDKLGWKPKNDIQKVLYFMAKRQSSEILKMREAAIEPLIEALRHDGLLVQLTATKILKKLTEQDFPRDYEAWSKWWQENKHKYQQKQEKE